MKDYKVLYPVGEVKEEGGKEAASSSCPRSAGHDLRQWALFQAGSKNLIDMFRSRLKLNIFPHDLHLHIQFKYKS